MKLTKLCLLLFLWQWTLTSQGQDLIGSLGTTYEVNGISMDISIGEVAITTLTGDQAILTQGLHQYYSAVIPLSTSQLFSNWKPLVYPNPVRDELTIESTSINLNVQVYDLNGRMVLESGLKSNEALDMRSLADGTYTLVLQESQTKNHQNYLLIKRK